MTSEQKEKLNILARYCAYQERCKADVLQKMFETGILPDERELFLKKLTAEDFVNDLRYAKSFVRGKFKINHWGKQKIKAALYQKGIDSETVKIALDEIDAHEYLSVAQTLADKQIPKIKAKNDFERKQKLHFYLSQKGFESQIIAQLKINRRD